MYRVPRTMPAKPLLLLAIVASALLAIRICAGLALSLAGDVFLMLPGDRFLPGLVSFLLAHLAYLGAFTSRLPFAPVVALLVAYGAVGAAILAVLWPGLSHRLRAPVATYVLVIATMAAGAFARWLERGGSLALAAAAGAGLFMLSDALLALDRFRRSFPGARATVLSTYWAAQLLIAVSVGGAA